MNSGKTLEKKRCFPAAGMARKVIGGARHSRGRGKRGEGIGGISSRTEAVQPHTLIKKRSNSRRWKHEASGGGRRAGGENGYPLRLSAERKRLNTLLYREHPWFPIKCGGKKRAPIFFLGTEANQNFNHSPQR